jgi:hypothetical protein
MSEKWMVNMIKAMWDLSCGLWINQNEFVHGKDEATKRAKLTVQLNAAVDQAFEKDKNDVAAEY